MIGRLRRASLADDDKVADDDSVGHVQAGSIQALDRGLALLSIIAQSEGLSLTGIAQRAGIAPSTAHRILATLKAAGFVMCDARGNHLIGVKAFKVGTAFLRNRRIVDVGRRTLRELMQASGETASMGIESDGLVVFVAQVECHRSIRAFHRPGSHGAMHASSLGKALLSTLPQKAVAEVLQRVGMKKFTEHTIVDPQALITDLAAAAKRGWAIDDQERADGMRCAGAPVFNEHGEAVGAISVSGPIVRITDERLGELGPLVKRAAADLTERFGGTPPAGGQTLRV
jgi:IclR family transcriptional regulator, acetate operon repressor